VWVKFGTTDLHILPLTNFEFCENLCSNSYTLLQHKNEILPVLYHQQSVLKHPQYSSCGARQQVSHPNKKQANMVLIF
jgi:hypothetical protein